MVQGRPKCFSHKPSSPPPSLSFSGGGGGVTWPTPKCCCWSLGPCLQGPCVVRHCHLYPLHFGGTLCIAFCEMEPDSTTICTPGTSTDVHPLHRGTRSGTRRWMLCYFIFRCNFCAPYCACTVVVATSPGELRGDRLPWMGGGGELACRHGVLFLSAAGSAYWPITIRCPSLGTFPSIGGGTHRPLTALCPSSPFPWSAVPTEPPDFPCFTALCQVHAEEGNCPCRWPGASKRSSQTDGEGPLPNGGFWARDVHLRGLSLTGGGGEDKGGAGARVLISWRLPLSCMPRTIPCRSTLGCAISVPSK